MSIRKIYIPMFGDDVIDHIQPADRPKQYSSLLVDLVRVHARRLLLRQYIVLATTIRP